MVLNLAAQGTYQPTDRPTDRAKMGRDGDYMKSRWVYSLYRVRRG